MKDIVIFGLLMLFTSAGPSLPIKIALVSAAIGLVWHFLTRVPVGEILAEKIKRRRRQKERAAEHERELKESMDKNPWMTRNDAETYRRMREEHRIITEILNDGHHSPQQKESTMRAYRASLSDHEKEVWDRAAECKMPVELPDMLRPSGRLSAVKKYFSEGGK